MLQTKYLKNYTLPTYLVDHIDLTFTINDDKTVQVQNRATYYKNPKATNSGLVLDGTASLISIAINNQVLNAQEHYELTNGQLQLKSNLPDSFSLTIITSLKPSENHSCSGLYVSNNNFITQCEPEGFRTITYYQDRPDVLAIFTTTITSKGGKYNTILSNGNKISEQVTNDLHTVKWHDPFKKPCYLYALVVGNFALMQDTYITKSGREIKLEIYSDPESISRCTHAMNSLKRSFNWDEQRFNLEYDLNTYMIVATSDFNMGAMENKGLNIFNTKYVLATKDTATDSDFIGVEAVIGHEYFHNWTGNRVTCCNWFQLSLKEGLTVFRDQEFTAALHDDSVKRIQVVKYLRQIQFTEDSGPLAHSVRPQSYIEINNFYTATVYEKGAEVVRMYQTILGKHGFNLGFAAYIKKYDGQAATCEDFCNAMSSANNFDLSQFMLWYEQAGTPEVTVTSSYNPDNFEYTLLFKQTIPDTPTQTNKQPMLIPIKIGLLNQQGQELHSIAPTIGKYVKHEDGLILLLTNTTNDFVFSNIKHEPIVSLLREFSAPIKLDYTYSNKSRNILISNDSDNFNRYEQLQAVFTDKICSIYHRIINNNNKSIDNDPDFWNIAKKLLNNSNIAPAFKALAFQIPSFAEMIVLLKNVNPKALTRALTEMKQQIGEHLFDSWMELYDLRANKIYDFNDYGDRSLKNTALFYILCAMSNKLNNNTSLQIIETLALGQYHNSHNMTDSFAVLNAVINLDIDIRKQVLQEFYTKWQNNELVMNKWFSIQALSNLVNVNQLNKLMTNKTFIATNPNKIYALLCSFTQNGLVFHSDDGYSFVANNVIIIDKFNPQVASRLAQGFSTTIYMAESYRNMAKIAIKRILEQQGLSPAVFEISSKILSVLTQFKQN